MTLHKQSHRVFHFAVEIGRSVVVSRKLKLSKVAEVMALKQHIKKSVMRMCFNAAWAKT